MAVMATHTHTHTQLGGVDYTSTTSGGMEGVICVGHCR